VVDLIDKKDIYEICEYIKGHSNVNYRDISYGGNDIETGIKIDYMDRTYNLIFQDGDNVAELLDVVLEEINDLEDLENSGWAGRI